MTRKDGKTALAAGILALACLLLAHGFGTTGQPSARAETFGQGAFPGSTANRSGSFTPAARQRPVRFPILAALWGRRPATPAGLPRIGRFGNVAYSNRRFFEGASEGAENPAAFPAAGGGQLQAPESLYFPNGAPDFSDDPTFYMPGPVFYRPSVALRFGWWGVVTDGSLTKVGEYQGLDSSPFYDGDALFSDGVRTVDMFATGLDNETLQTSLDFFGPHLQADVDYQRYLHRLDHDPLTNMGDMQSGEEIVRQDLNVGEDYAVRVQDIKSSFRGKLSKNIKVRFNFGLLRKQGERQAIGVQHCAGGVPQDFGGLPNNTCHALSQRQRIDWLTLKFEPVVEIKVGPVRAEYSRLMRVFSQDDQPVTGTFGLHFPTEQQYAFVPENFTQSDRLKLGVDLASSTTFYGRLQTGDTHNKYRQTHRSFYGFDLRLTNQSWDGLTLTGYATLNEQKNQSLPFFLPDEEEALAVTTSGIPPYGIRHPIDYFRRAVGAEASWHPFRGDTTWSGLVLTTGAEQSLIERHFAQYVVQEPEEPPGPTFDQKHTPLTTFHTGASMRWVPGLETYVRYRLRVTKDPLFAVNRYYGYTNTSLPTEENLVDVGGTWMLASNFLATVSVGLENRAHRSEIARFDENNYPMTFTLWWAPTPQWSMSAGYGIYSNWIDQDITFPSDTPGLAVGDTQRWSYGGRGRVLSVGGSYAWARRLTLVGGVQFVWARDTIDPLAPWPDLPQYIDVAVDRTRITGGFDWSLREQISAYFRYVYEDYDDISAAFNSGTAHMFLGGFSAVF